MKEKVLSYLKDQRTPYFQLEANGNVIAANKGKTATANASEAEQLLSNSLNYVSEGSKVVIRCYPEAEAYNRATVYETFLTEDGRQPNAAAPLGAFSGAENNSILSIYMAGMKAGEERGVLLAKLESIEQRLQDGDPSNDLAARFDLNTIVSNLTATEKGHEIIHGLMQRFGWLNNTPTP